MEELDRAFLNNRIEVARSEDITLRESDVLLQGEKQFSDPVADFGENSTLKEQLVLEYGVSTLLQEKLDNAEILLQSTPQRVDETLREFSKENLEPVVDVINVPIEKRPSRAPVTVLSGLEKELSEATEKGTKEQSKRKRRKRARRRSGPVSDDITTIPYEEMRGRLSKPNLHTRPRSSLFDIREPEEFSGLLERKFATSIANRIFGEECFPKPRLLNPISFQEALDYDSVFIKEFGLNASNSAITEEAEAERCRGSTSTFQHSVSTRTATRLTEDLKVSDINDSNGLITEKVSESLEPFLLREHTEDWSELSKSSHLLQNLTFHSEVAEGNELSSSAQLQLAADLGSENLVNEDLLNAPEGFANGKQVHLQNELGEAPSLQVAEDDPVIKESKDSNRYISCGTPEELFKSIEFMQLTEGVSDVRFSSLLQKCSNVEAARGFSNLLLLLKQNRIRVLQDVPFGDIRILANTH
ncbi:unnamed protein product [Enterobius vermicularis]|uniref:Rad21_Rec8 domain-containing protein n=1 Tax=Enterobius vermicularis TaxID=51028 RepID=A0A0N4V504_ENTVE|nr:unnamed protein product [Enterobius vermicularis]